MPDPVIAHFAAARPARGEDTCVCCHGRGEHPDGTKCKVCEDGIAPYGQVEYCEGHEPRRTQRRRRHWRQGAMHTAAIRMVPPEEYSKFSYPDYPEKTLPSLVRRFSKHPYWETLRRDAQQNGIRDPVLVRYRSQYREFPRPRVMDGHHRAAMAYHLGLDLPVGDYDDADDFAKAHSKHDTQWWQAHMEQRLAEPPPWKRAEAGVDEYGGGHRPMEDGAPLHDLTQMFPEDVYTHPHYYEFGEPSEYGLEHRSALSKARGNPDAKVRIYRAAPAVNPGKRASDLRGEFNAGDWVTLDRQYAQSHADAHNEPTRAGRLPADHPERMHVWRATVPAHTVRNGGSDLYEWGYWGDHKDAIHFPSCSHRPLPKGEWEREGSRSMSEEGAEWESTEPHGGHHIVPSDPHPEYPDVVTGIQPRHREASADDIPRERWRQMPRVHQTAIMSTDAKDELHPQLAAAGHDMEWKHGSGWAQKGRHQYWEGNCRNCGASVTVSYSGTSCNTLGRDAREGQCAGPGTRWQNDMLIEHRRNKLNKAVSQFGQDVKNEFDKQWLREQGFEASYVPPRGQDEDVHPVDGSMRYHVRTHHREAWPYAPQHDERALYEFHRNRHLISEPDEHEDDEPWPDAARGSQFIARYITEDEARDRGRQGPWYHATFHEFEPGQHVEPGHEGFLPDNPDLPYNQRSHVYMFDDKDLAHGWIGEHHQRLLDEYGPDQVPEQPHVYEVEPQGRIEHDPEAEDEYEQHAYRSRQPLRVVRKISAAQEGPQYYHGTRAELKPGDMIYPGHTKVNYPTKHRPERDVRAWATTDPKAAQGYARDSRAQGIQRVYLVDPVGTVYRSPDQATQHEYSSFEPFRVRKEVWHDTSWGHEPNPEAKMHSLAAVSLDLAGPWYHGSQNPFESGQYVNPRLEKGKPLSDGTWTYLTSDKLSAYGLGGPHVHEVVPMTAIEHDPHETSLSPGVLYRSRGPLKVIRRLSDEEVGGPRPGDQSRRTGAVMSSHGGASAETPPSARALDPLVAHFEIYADATEDMVDLWHHTSPEAAGKIIRERRFSTPGDEEETHGGEPGHAYFMDRPHPPSSYNWGEDAVHVRIPRRLVEDDPESPRRDATWQHEQWYSVPHSVIQPHHIIGLAAADANEAIADNRDPGTLEYGPEPKHEHIPEDLPEEEHTRRVYEMIDRRRDWKSHMKRGLSLGHLTNESAKALGYHGGGHEQDNQGQLKWQQMPRELYHVTTDLPSVRRHGLKTRNELNQFSGHGLGGGEDDTISLTDSRETGRNILRALHEFHDVLNHRYTPEQMWEDAKAGRGADRPYHEGIARYYKSDWKHGDELPEQMRNMFAGRTVKRHGLVYTQPEMEEREGHGWTPQDEGWDTPKGRVHYSWQRPSTEDEKRDNAADFYKAFARHREHEGGPEDPMFFASDTKALAAKNPRDFGMVHVSPRPGAQGYQVHALGEWRTGTGDALHVHHFEQLHHPGQVHEAAGGHVYGPFYHAGSDPLSRTDEHYVHVGTLEAAQARHGGDRTVHRVWIHARNPLNTPEHPVDDHSANAIGIHDATWKELGREPGQMDFDEYWEDAPKIARQHHWHPGHDAVFYENSMETELPTLSAMVRPSALRSHPGTLHEAAADPDYLRRLRFEEYETGNREPGLAAMHGDDEVGHIEWHPGSGRIMDIEVPEHLRRRGIGTHLYHKALEIDPGITHSERRTDLGDAWARSLGEPLPENELEDDLRREAMATDWEEHYARIPDEIHRGLYAPESHDVFSWPQSDEDIVHGLIAAHQDEQFGHHPDRHRLFGTHWTSDEGVARNFAQEHYDNHHDPYEGEEHDHEQHSEAVPVVFHAERPARHEIEHDERRLGWQNVDDFDEAEHEVPIAHGAPVRIKGASWLKHTALGPMWVRHDLREPVTLRAHDDDSPDDPNRWNASLHEAARQSGEGIPGKVYQLPAHEFASRFKPTEYGYEWDDVAEYAENEKTMPALSGKGMAYEPDKLSDEPVDVSRGGWVEDGHHRVIRAIERGHPVRYRYVGRRHDSEHYASLHAKLTGAPETNGSRPARSVQAAGSQGVALPGPSLGARFYHGSPAELNRGDYIEPGHPGNFTGGRPSQHVYFTSSPEAADQWAEDAIRVRRDDYDEDVSHLRPHTYEVEPTGEHWEDWENEPGDDDTHRDYMSAHPLRVIRRLSMGARGPDITGLQFHHHIETEKPGESYHVLFAHPGTLTHCAHCENPSKGLDYVQDPSKFVGSLAWRREDHEWGGPAGEITALEVHPALRRRGIANQLVDEGWRYDPPPEHSADRSDMGEEWARARERKYHEYVPDLDEARWSDEYHHHWEPGTKLSPELKAALKGQLRPHKEAANQEGGELPQFRPRWFEPLTIPDTEHETDPAFIKILRMGDPSWEPQHWTTPYEPRHDEPVHYRTTEVPGNWVIEKQVVKPDWKHEGSLDPLIAHFDHTAGWKEDREAKGDRWHEFRNRYSTDLHRGIHVELPPSLHAMVHDERHPLAERALALSDHLKNRGYGMHWTPHINIAERSIWNAADHEHYRDDEDYYYPDEYDEGAEESSTPSTDVILHARRPAKRSEIRDKDTLEEHAVGWQYSKDEDEFPIKPGAPVHLTGISWKLHEPEYPNEPFEHHDFARPVRHQAAVVRTQPGPAPGHEDHGTAIVWLSSDLGDRPRCNGCGHRVTHPETGIMPRQTRELGPQAWAIEHVNRERAKRQAAVHPQAGQHGDLPELEYEHNTGRDLPRVGYTPEEHVHALSAWVRGHPHDTTNTVADLTWSDEGHPSTPSTVHSVYIEPAWRRRGIASELFRRAREITPGLKHSDDLSGDARRWIRGMGDDPDRYQKFSATMPMRHQAQQVQYGEEHPLYGHRHPEYGEGTELKRHIRREHGWSPLTKTDLEDEGYDSNSDFHDELHAMHSDGDPDARPRQEHYHLNTEDPEDTRCTDCGAETLSPEPGVPTEHYMVHDELWHQAGATRKDHLCIGCLEKRLGRTLNKHDFKPMLGVNNPHMPEDPRYAWSYRTPRLKDRLTREAALQGPFYHGTTRPLSAGDLVRPEDSQNDYWPDELGEQAGPKVKRVFFTRDQSVAHAYGIGWQSAGGVYRVEPTGPFYPHRWEHGTLVSAHPLRVLEQVEHQPARREARRLSVRLAAADFRKVAPYLGDASVETLPGDFRRVVFTSPRTQLVTMTLKPHEEIGAEKHGDGDQLFVFLGNGIVEVDGSRRIVTPGCMMAIPQGTEHNVIAGDSPLRLITIYSPPQHAAGTIHPTKADAAREHKTAVLVRTAEYDPNDPEDEPQAMIWRKYMPEPEGAEAVIRHIRSHHAPHFDERTMWEYPLKGGGTGVIHPSPEEREEELHGAHERKHDPNYEVEPDGKAPGAPWHHHDLEFEEQRRQLFPRTPQETREHLRAWHGHGDQVGQMNLRELKAEHHLSHLVGRHTVRHEHETMRWWPNEPHHEASLDPLIAHFDSHDYSGPLEPEPRSEKELRQHVEWMHDEDHQDEPLDKNAPVSDLARAHGEWHQEHDHEGPLGFAGEGGSHASEQHTHGTRPYGGPVDTREQLLAHMDREHPTWREDIMRPTLGDAVMHAIDPRGEHIPRPADVYRERYLHHRMHDWFDNNGEARPEHPHQHNYPEGPLARFEYGHDLYPRAEEKAAEQGGRSTPYDLRLEREMGRAHPTKLPIRRLKPDEWVSGRGTDWEHDPWKQHFSAKAYMPEPDDSELGEHLERRHGMDREQQLHGNTRHWHHWHYWEHKRTSSDHQHDEPSGAPLEERFPAAHDIPEDAPDVMGISGGRATHSWETPGRTGPVLLPDPNQHLSALDPLLAAFAREAVPLPHSQLKLFDMKHERAHLPNPYTGEKEWFHGSPHAFDRFDDPASGKASTYQYEPGDTEHWNTFLGTHFAADHHIAREFSKGEHHNPDYEDEWEEEEPSRHVIHARLRISRPKHYASEHDMDQEAYEHEFRAGNHPETHLDMATYRDAQNEGWDRELKGYEPAYHFVDHKDRMRGPDEPDPMRAALGFRPTEQHRYATGWLNTHPDKAGIAERFRQRLKSQGYNGITYGNEFEKSTRGRHANTAAIAFDPDQIEVRHHEQPMLHEGATAGPVSRLSTPLPHGTRYWTPSSGIFAPTTGFDPLLFTEGEGDPRLRPEVRREILDKLKDALQVVNGVLPVSGRGKPVRTRAYLAGGAVSEWAGGRPNQGASDLDVLIGIDYGRLRQDGVAEAIGAGTGLDDAELDAALNHALRLHFNDEAWHPAFGGVWSLTGYVNPHAWDITALKPYAAYDLTNDRWAVKPPHSPEHPVELGYDPGPSARALMQEIRAALHLPEPYRSGQARAIWDRIHDERSRTFSREGEGYTGPGNVIEKFLAYHPWRPLDKLREVVFASGTKAA